jgi:hypothetical protein
MEVFDDVTWEFEICFDLEGVSKVKLLLEGESRKLYKMAKFNGPAES